MASKFHHGPTASLPDYPHVASSMALANHRALHLDSGISPTSPYGQPSTVEVLALGTYISALECELERREHRYAETIDRYESLLTAQRHRYQTRIHELEGQGCYCDTDSAFAHGRKRPGLISSMVTRLTRQK